MLTKLVFIRADVKKEKEGVIQEQEKGTAHKVHLHESNQNIQIFFFSRTRIARYNLTKHSLDIFRSLILVSGLLRIPENILNIFG